ncbi:hypothetical protein KR222_009054, partial [Zaprionus bogoriensis]
FEFQITGGYRPGNNALAKYVVSLRLKQQKFFGDGHFCGGAIISTKIVLTAGHCVNNRGRQTRPSMITLVAGTPRRMVRTANTQELSIKKIKVHPKFVMSGVFNDVALLILEQEVILNDFVAVIPLVDDYPEPGTQCTAIGWGRLMVNGPLPDELINADLTINTDAKCQSYVSIRKGILCASNPQNELDSVCSGDSGGPLICNNKVAGVTSFVVLGQLSPGYFADVSHFRDWIEANAGCRHGMQLIVWWSIYMI